MPTYQYKCLECKTDFEFIQKMVDPPLTECIHCAGKVKRIISAGAGIIFKGSGFYCTDYRSDNYKKQAERENKSNTPPTEKSSKKSNGNKKTEKTTTG